MAASFPEAGLVPTSHQPPTGNALLLVFGATTCQLPLVRISGPKLARYFPAQRSAVGLVGTGLLPQACPSHPPPKNAAQQPVPMSHSRLGCQPRRSRQSCEQLVNIANSLRQASTYATGPILGLVTESQSTGSSDSPACPPVSPAASDNPPEDPMGGNAYGNASGPSVTASDETSFRPPTVRGSIGTLVTGPTRHALPKALPYGPLTVREPFAMPDFPERRSPGDSQCPVSGNKLVSAIHSSQTLASHTLALPVPPHSNLSLLNV